MSKKCLVIASSYTQNNSSNNFIKAFANIIVTPKLEPKYKVETLLISQNNLSKASERIQYLGNEDLVIVVTNSQDDLLLYQLGLLHALSIPFIIAHEKSTKLKFDISNETVIPYENHLVGINHFQNQLVQHINKDSVHEAKNSALINGVNSHITRPPVIHMRLNSKNNIDAFTNAPKFDSLIIAIEKKIGVKPIVSTDSNLNQLFIILNHKNEGSLKGIKQLVNLVFKDDDVTIEYNHF